jgi:hypothetical protein
MTPLHASDTLFARNADNIAAIEERYERRVRARLSADF